VKHIQRWTFVFYEADEACGSLAIAISGAVKLRRKANHALDAFALGVARPIQRAGLLAVGFP
jgi:hypothetical protein